MGLFTSLIHLINHEKKYNIVLNDLLKVIGSNLSHLSTSFDDATYRTALGNVNKRLRHNQRYSAAMGRGGELQYSQQRARSRAVTVCCNGYSR